MPSKLKPRTLPELYRLAAETYAGLAAFATRTADGEFESVSFAELYDRGLALAAALRELGVQAGDRVALFADNRIEWITADYAVQLCGAADVPRGSDVTEAEIRYITQHAETQVVFIEDAKLLEKFRRATAEQSFRHVILMDRRGGVPSGVLGFQELLERGRELRAQGDRSVEETMAAIRPDDIFTIIYTSGTTGTPKGVPLSHANMCSQIRCLPFTLHPGERALSILPVWHSYERVFEMVTIAYGATTYYTSLRTIGEDLRNVKPTVMASAPRLWESLHHRILDKMESAPPPRRALFRAAYAVARNVQRARLFFGGQDLQLTPRSRTEWLAAWVGHAMSLVVSLIPFLVLDGLVLRKLREVVGGHFRGTISGGGALPPHVDEFFNYIGIPVLEGYGLTETSPVLAVRTWDYLVIGTVGRIFKETEVRIYDLQTGEILYPDRSRKGRGRGLKGEIVVKGPQVMSGYYKDPARTAEVLHDGWFRTGDIGMVTFNDCIKIIGRCKDTIVLLNGENVEPVPIENRLCESPLISQCMVTGQDQKFLGVLIVPNLDAFRAAGIRAANVAELESLPEVAELVNAELKRLVSTETGFKAFERIVSWRLISKAFEVGDELTSTFKLKRHVISEKYAEILKSP